MTFLEKLNQLMTEKGVTRGGLAKGSGVPYTTIVGLYDKGYENIKLSTVKKLAGFFDVSIEYLCNDDEEIRDRQGAGACECDNEVVQLCKRIEAMSPKEREILVRLLDAVFEFAEYEKAPD